MNTFILRIFSLVLLSSLISQTSFAAPSCHQIIEKAHSARYELSESALQTYKADDGPRGLKIDIARTNNEKKPYLFGKAEIKGGSLLGLGGDNNLTIAAMSGHTHIFIYDMDPRVIAFHKIIEAGFNQNKTPESFLKFIERWQDGTLVAAQKEILARDIGGPEMLNELRRLLVNSNLKEYFLQVSRAQNEHGNPYTYLGRTDYYNHIRSLFVMRQIHFYVGSHFDASLLQLIALDVRRAENPLSAIYMSNALESRWTIDRRSPEAGMVAMLIGMGGEFDRGLFSAQIERIKSVINKLETQKDIPSEEKERLMNEISDSVSMLPMTAQLMQLSRPTINTLAQGLAQMPMAPHARILSTKLEPFEVNGMSPGQYKILGIENFTLDNGGTVSWTYAQASAVKFISQMHDSTVKFAEKIMSELQTLAPRLMALAGGPRQE